MRIKTFIDEKDSEVNSFCSDPNIIVDSITRCAAGDHFYTKQIVTVVYHDKPKETPWSQEELDLLAPFYAPGKAF